MPNIFTKLFKTKREPVTQTAILTSGGAYFTPFSGDAYANDIYRAAVDAIARNAAKLKGTHVIKNDTGRTEGDRPLNRLLQTRPNPYTSAFDMVYRMVAHYYLYNNSFAYLQKDDRGELTGIYPLRPSSVEFLTDVSGELYARFHFDNGNQYIFPYSDVIHLRRNYNSNDLLGDQNTALLPALELAHTQNEGIIQGIKSGAHIRGVLRFNTMLTPENKKAEKDQFMNDYLQMDNNGGVIATDSKMDYSPLKMEPYAIDDKQLQAAKSKIYAYLGVSEAIVTGAYREHEWAAFYESVIEPIAVQLSLEFTAKVFTAREQILR
ncbi:MAG: phage portal protein [Clostridiales bacterium]|jgi:HK97 family phage portal protein|nr:phage portal protein [Clostridiales bacterium]